MKKRMIMAIMAVYMILGNPGTFVLAEETENAVSLSNGTDMESEHPPLSEETKKAIAAYKQNPGEETKQEVLDALNQAYDQVVQRKKENLSRYTEEKESKIEAWLEMIVNGENPPFMSLETENDKGDERLQISNVSDAYRQNPTNENKQEVKEALEAYYDAFLAEQQAHITETEEERDQRIAASLDKFTSDRFDPQITEKDNRAAKEDVMGEIMAVYISAGAQILPVNPEARVQERTYNVAITDAQNAYLEDSSEENKIALQEILTEAFQTLYDTRVKNYASAEEKGNEGALDLFQKMLDSSFRDGQYKDLTEQMNLYGRIDRMITFGSNTYDNWVPRMAEESRELYQLFESYETSATDENLKAAQDKFSELYDSMLETEKTQLDNAGENLSVMVEETLQSLID